MAAFGWLIFRAKNLEQAGAMFLDIIRVQSWGGLPVDLAFRFAMIVLPFFCIQLAQESSGGLMVIRRMPVPVRIFIYAAMTCLVFVWGVLTPEEFIYFQF
jgi:hypothetical protein